MTTALLARAASITRHMAAKGRTIDLLGLYVCQPFWKDLVPKQPTTCRCYGDSSALMPQTSTAVSRWPTPLLCGGGGMKLLLAIDFELYVQREILHGGPTTYSPLENIPKGNDYYVV